MSALSLRTLLAANTSRYVNSAPIEAKISSTHLSTLETVMLMVGSRSKMQSGGVPPATGQYVGRKRSAITAVNLFVMFEWVVRAISAGYLMLQFSFDLD